MHGSFPHGSNNPAEESLSDTAKTVDTTTHKDENEEIKDGGVQNVRINKVNDILDTTQEEESFHDEEEEEEINFDQLLGDAARSQADYEEDRDDSDDDDIPLDASLSYTQTQTKTNLVSPLDPITEEEKVPAQDETVPQQMAPPQKPDSTEFDTAREDSVTSQTSAQD